MGLKIRTLAAVKTALDDGIECPSYGHIVDLGNTSEWSEGARKVMADLCKGTSYDGIPMFDPGQDVAPTADAIRSFCERRAKKGPQEIPVKVRHEITASVPLFDAVWRGDMTFLVIKDTRGYQAGEWLEIVEATERPFRRRLLAEIPYVFRGDGSIAVGFVVCGLRELARDKLDTWQPTEITPGMREGSVGP